MIFYENFHAYICMYIYTRIVINNFLILHYLKGFVFNQMAFR